MWLVVAVAAAAFVGNLGAELVAEGVADLTAAMYWDWFWSLDVQQALADAAKEFERIQTMIAEADQHAFRPLPAR